MARPSNWNHLGGTPKVGTTWGCRGGLKGGDSRGGWAGNSSLSLLRRSLSSACGSVWRVSWISRPSVVGISMSISCRAANFSRTLLGLRPGASAASRLASAIEIGARTLWLRQIHPRQQARSEARAQPPRGHGPDPPSQHPRAALLPLGEAILDRLVHNAHRIELTGESLRRARGKQLKTA
jgi:hypothetical protein